MGWASKQGHAYADETNLDAAFQCDRCGEVWNTAYKTNQKEWRGTRMMPLNIMVCPPCLDVPFVYNKPIIIPPDPIPVMNPRPYQTNTGEAGWSQGAGWSIGPWSVGSNFVGPAKPTEYAPPQNNTVSVDED